MSDAELEMRLRAIRAEAWAAILAAHGDPSQVFAAAAEVYERELRLHASVDAASDADWEKEVRAISKARDIAYEMLDQLVNFCPERTDVERIIAELDKVLGPDLVREADPTGQVLKSLPFDERKRMLDALDMVQDVVDERGSGQPPLILILEDEMGPILEVGSPEHDAFCMEETAKMAAEDVARGEGE